MRSPLPRQKCRCKRGNRKLRALARPGRRLAGYVSVSDVRDRRSPPRTQLARRGGEPDAPVAGGDPRAAADRARRLPDAGSARQDHLHRQGRQPARARAAVLPAQHRRHARLRAVAGRHRPGHRDHGDLERKRGAAAGKPSDQAAPAALQREAARRQELPGAAAGSRRGMAAAGGGTPDEGRRRATTLARTIRPRRAARPCGW